MYNVLNYRKRGSMQAQYLIGMERNMECINTESQLYAKTQN